MKKYLFKTNHRYLFLIISICISHFANAQLVHIELEELLNQKAIQLAARGTGGYFGKKMVITLQNLHTKPILVKISAGTLFSSEDERIQDLMILEDYQFAIQKGATKILPVQTACIQASNGAPYHNAIYLFNKLDKEGLAKIAQAISTHDYFNDYTAQSSVWCVSNNHNVANLSNPKQQVFEDLAKAVCEAQQLDFDKINFAAQKQYIPTYTYQGFVQTFLENDELITIEAYTEDGNLFKTIVSDFKAEKGFFYRPFMLTQQLGEDVLFKIKVKAGNKIILEQNLTKDTPAHNVDMKLIENKNRLVFVADSAMKLSLGIYDEEGRLYHRYFSDKVYPKSAQTVINLRHNAFIPVSNTYFLIAKDENGKEITRERMYTNGKKPDRQEMLVQRYNFEVNLVDPISGVNLDVYDQYGNKVANLLENSVLHHGYRILPTVFKHYLGHKQTFFYRMTDKNGVLIQEHVVEGK